jgi:predicted O-methyltransferase YrrM
VNIEHFFSFKNKTIRSLNQLLNYITYLFKSTNLHGIHSPFVYGLVKDVIYNRKIKSPNFKAIENIRKSMVRNINPLGGEDFGAGSLKKGSKKTIGQFATSSSKSAKYSKLLFRLAQWHQPKYAIELGTALGISTLYQASGFNDTATFYTLEGNSELADLALQNFEKIDLKKPELIVGNFDETLEKALEKIPRLDWVFFDGNHKKEPTLRYFNQCLEKASENALFIFDDINWSNEMKEAWEEIKQSPDIYLSIDLFFLGLVFTKKRPQKENFVVRF